MVESSKVFPQTPSACTEGEVVAMLVRRIVVGMVLVLGWRVPPGAQIVRKGFVVAGFPNISDTCFAVSGVVWVFKMVIKCVIVGVPFLQ
jgi:hypothetical protein